MNIDRMLDTIAAVESTITEVEPEAPQGLREGSTRLTAMRDTDQIRDAHGVAR